MNIKADFFEKIYTHNSDPWGFASNPYELNRYLRICEIIGHQKHQHIFEAGCSIGVLTKELAHLGDFVEAIDISEKATSLAKERCENLINVNISCSSLMEYAFNPLTDLFILSEIGYYFTREKWEYIIKKILDNSHSSFYLLASHWLGVSSDHIMSGDEVHSTINSQSLLQLEHSERHKDFRLDYWIKK